MDNFQITKSLRFKLESSNQNNLINDTIKKLNTQKEFDLANFAQNLNNYTNNLATFLFYKDKKEERRIKENIVLQKTWLKLYAKREFASCKNAKSLTINTCELSEKIETYFNNLKEVCETLLNYSGEEKHKQTEKRAIALLLNKLNTKSYLPFFVDLVKSAKNKNEKDNLSIILQSEGSNISNQLQQGIAHFLPEQSAGICITKASFNYYTIDKQEKKWENEEGKIIKGLETDINSLENEYRSIQNIWSKIKKDIETRSDNKTLYLGDYHSMDTETAVSLRQILKNIKSEQKSKFNELMQQNIPYKHKNYEELYLFKDIENNDFTKYSDLTNEIKQLSDEKNQTSDEEKKKELTLEIENKAKKRGELLKNFRYYKAFSNFYKKISEKHGREKAKLLGIEKEKVESQLLNYWAVMMECEGKHQLVLIPRGEKAQNFKKEIEEASNSETSTKLYWFESLTYRSLQKLCFGNPLTNTFKEGIKDILQSKNIQGEFSFNGNEKAKINFYKDVLKHKYTKSVLKFPHDEVYNNVVNKQFDNLEDFKIALEQVCYKRCITTNKHLIDNLASEFSAQIFDITSLDLRREENTKDKAEKYTYKEKRPTLLWREFWKEENEENGFEVRLNPEISIIYRTPKESRIEKYGADSKKNNRYLHEQFTLVMTFNEHCNTPTKNLAFADITKEEEVIKEFNERFKKEIISFALGIDNGVTELSTLGVYFPEFEQATNGEKIEELSNVEKYGFDTLTINDLKYKETDRNGEEKEIYKNVSYFLKEDLYCRTFNKTHEDYEEMKEKVFEKKCLLSLDLSAAKLVCGHIVTNGDVKALYNLWLKHAQRNVYDMNSHSKKDIKRPIDVKISEDLNDNEKKFFVNSLNKNNEKYNALSDEEKKKYIDWLYEFWNGNKTTNENYEKIRNNQEPKGHYRHWAVAIAYKNANKTDENIEAIKYIFQIKREFDSIKSREEIKQDIEKGNLSIEELDLKLNQAKSSIVANAIGIIDFLYKQYKKRFSGEGIIVKEGFGKDMVDSKRNDFSANIYRMLERKLYQKFQNYGLVPPVKNVLAFREEDKAFVQFGNICFINYEGTSQRCPVCGNGKLNHTETCSENCGFKSEGIMHSNDGIAGFNIAKKGFIEVTKK